MGFRVFVQWCFDSPFEHNVYYSRISLADNDGGDDEADGDDYDGGSGAGKDRNDSHDWLASHSIRSKSLIYNYI